MGKAFCSWMVVGLAASGWVLAGEVPLQTSNPAAVERAAWPVTVSIPFPPGELPEDAPVAVVGPDGRPVPAQTATQALWWERGRTVQSVLVSFVPNPGISGYRLVYGPGTPANPAPAQPVRMARDRDRLTVETGALRASFDLARSPALAGLEQHGQRVATPGALTAGDWVAARPEQVALEESGPVRAVLALRGGFVNGAGERLLGYLVRYTFHAGWPAVQADVTFIQDSGRVFIDVPEIAYRLGLPEGPREARIGTAGPPLRLGAGESAMLLQLGPRRPEPIVKVEDEAFRKMSEAVREWRTPAESALWDRDERQKVFDVVTTAAGREVARAARSDGWVSLRTANRPVRLSAGVRWFWQLHPKAVSLTPSELSFGLVPAAVGPLHLHLGAAKTHRLLFAVEPAEGSPGTAWQRGLEQPPMVFASPEWMCGSGVWGVLEPASPGRYRAYEERMTRTLTNQFVDKVEKDQLYGLMDWGDSIYNKYQWNNMETALDYGLFIQFIRTGDRRFFDWFDRAVCHFRDVDVSHADLTEDGYDYGMWMVPGYMPERLARECARMDAVGAKLRQQYFYYLGDQPPYKGGIRRHSFNHYQNASVAPARPDHPDPKVAGRLYGGTCTVGGHGWMIGTLAHAQFLGDAWSMETARLSGELILDKLSQPTIGRDNWKNIDVVHLYRVTGDPRYAEVARQALEFHYNHRVDISKRVDSQDVDHLTPYYTIGQFFREWYDVTGDATVAHHFREMVDGWLNGVEKNLMVPSSSGPIFGYIAQYMDSRCHGDFADAAFCAMLTNDRTYLDRILPSFDVYMFQADHSTALFEVPRILVALRHFGIELFDHPYEGRLRGYDKLTGTATKAPAAPLNLWVSVTGGFRNRLGERSGSVTLLGPGGAVVLEKLITTNAMDAWRWEVPAEAPAGEYRLVADCRGVIFEANAEPGWQTP